MECRFLSETKVKTIIDSCYPGKFVDHHVFLFLSVSSFLCLFHHPSSYPLSFTTSLVSSSFPRTADQLRGHDVREHISQLNNGIRWCKFAIEKVINDEDGLDYYVFVNLASNDTTVSTSIHIPRNMDSFNYVLNSILKSEEKKVSKIEIENGVIEHVKKFKKTNTMMKAVDAEELVDSWIRRNLLHRFDDGMITLGFVALAEFSYWIQNKYPDAAVKCSLCKSILLVGDKCSSCSSALHFACKRKIERSTNKCPECS